MKLKINPIVRFLIIATLTRLLSEKAVKKDANVVKLLKDVIDFIELYA